VTSRNTPIDQPDFESVQRIWDDVPIDPKALQHRQEPDLPEPAPAPVSSPVELDGCIHLRSDAAEVDLIGQNRMVRVEIRRGADMRAVKRFLVRFADSSSPLWPLARALGVSVDVAVDGTRVAFYDASAPDNTPAPTRDHRPGTDRRLDTDEPYGDWTYL